MSPRRNGEMFNSLPYDILMLRQGLFLHTIIDSSQRLQQVEKASLRAGDLLLVRTSNSVYTIRAHGGGIFGISGGWFDRRGLSPAKVRISGCTWGGSAIKIDAAAVCGLCLEFENHVVTTPVREIIFLPYGSQN